MGVGAGAVMGKRKMVGVGEEATVRREDLVQSFGLKDFRGLTMLLHAAY